ncbi:MAG: hypothetical protein KY475_07515 [Planctomycetes bacterium]|nr:hypothetical protein [Planctomycetota bacterium]
MTPKPAASRNLIGYIMLALIVWGTFLAGGAYLYGGVRQALKALIIFGCVAAFLGLWALLLKYRTAAADGDSLPDNRPGKPPKLDE